LIIAGNDGAVKAKIDARERIASRSEGQAIPMSKALKSHPYADLFPMMTADELEALAEDIKENGLRQPIVRYQGEVLDGRNRLLACQKAGVEPTFTEHEGDEDSALLLVLSLNAQRRDLTPGQRAIVAAKVFERLPERRGGDRTKSKVPDSGTLKSRDSLAQRFRVGKNAIQQASTLLENAPDLAGQVEAQLANITNAYLQYQNRLKEQERRGRESALIRDFQEAVDNGEITFEEAVKKAREQAVEEERKANEDEQGRRLFFQAVSGVITAIDRWIGAANEEYLKWYLAGETQFSDYGITGEALAAALKELSRLHTFVRAKETSDGHKKFSRSRGKGLSGI
jgi:ParB-like chromosome segregation protein Spo0J